MGERIYTDWLLKLKDRLSKKRNCPPVSIATKTLEEEIERKIESMLKLGGRAAGIYSGAGGETFQADSAGDSLFSYHVLPGMKARRPERKYEDAVMTYGWLMYHVVHSLMSCVIGGVLLFLATLLLHFARKDRGSEEIFNDISYAVALALSAMLTNTVVAVYLMCFSFNDDGYSGCASQLEKKLLSLAEDVSHLEAILADDDDDSSLELVHAMIPPLEGPLFDILSFGYIANEKIMEVISQVEPIAQKSFWHGVSAAHDWCSTFQQLPEIAATGPSFENQAEDDDLEELHEKLKKAAAR